MRRWFVSVLACGLISAGAFAAAPPLPRVVEAGLGVDLADVVTLPPGDGGDPAYVSYLFHAPDGSGRLFVSDMRGRIYIIKGGKLLAGQFLDLNEARAGFFGHTSHANGETGLLTFAFHPDFARKGALGYGKVYTLHSENNQTVAAPGITVFPGPKPQPHHFNVLSEWSVDPANPDRIDPRSRREILRLAFHSDDHGGGQVGFDPNVAGRRCQAALYLGG